jgi:hypothetical protein
VGRGSAKVLVTFKLDTTSNAKKVALLNICRVWNWGHERDPSSFIQREVTDPDGKAGC